MFALQSIDFGSILLKNHIKDFKNDICNFPASHQHDKASVAKKQGSPLVLSLGEALNCVSPSSCRLGCEAEQATCRGDSV